MIPLIRDIWGSFRALPVWVRVWVFLWLVPVNMASLLFLAQPGGLWVAFLANIAMLGNLPVLIMDRGFSKRMALPHLLPWALLAGLLLLARPEAAGVYGGYLWLLLGTNIVSLAFDVTDALKWWTGARGVAGRPSDPA